MKGQDLTNFYFNETVSFYLPKFFSTGFHFPSNVLNAVPSLSLSLCNFRTKLPPLAGLPVPLGCRPPFAGPSFTGVLYPADLAAGSVSGDAKKRYSPALSLSLSLSLSGQICWRVFSLLNTVVIRKFFLFDFVRGLLH
jgi:hypothetical protein